MASIIMKSWHIPRRTVLRGIGTSIALPFLNLMRPTDAEAAPPVHLVLVITPNGFLRSAMQPGGGQSYTIDRETVRNVGAPVPAGTALSNFTLAESAQSLADIKQDILFLTGINDEPHAIDGHNVVQFLSASVPTGGGGSWAATGASFDQIMASKLQATGVAFPALTINTRNNRVGEGGFIGALPEYAKHYVSWSLSKTFVRPREDLAAVFTQVLGGQSTAAPPPTPADSAAEAKRKARIKSLLDSALPRIDALNKRLGAEDRTTLGQYLQGIRDVERGLAALPPAPAQCGKLMLDTSVTGWPAKVKLAMDMIALIIACDRSRIIVYQTDGETNEARYSHITVPPDLKFDGQSVSDTDRAGIQNALRSSGYHRSIAHREGGSFINMTGAQRMIDRDVVGRYGYLVRELKARGLLDSSMITFASPQTDGNTHAHNNIPVMIAGRGNGAIPVGRYIDFQGGLKEGTSLGQQPGGQPFARLLLTFAGIMGVPLPSLGPATAPLALT